MFASISSSFCVSISCSFNAWASRFKLPPAANSLRFGSNGFVRSLAIVVVLGLTCQIKIKALSRELSWVIAHAWCIKILTWLRGFLVIFLYLVCFFFTLRSFRGIARQWSREKFENLILSLKPRSYVRILLGLFEVSMEFSPKLINLGENPSHSKMCFPVGNSPIFHE